MDTSFQQNIDQLKKLLSQPKNITLLSHKNPDGDAIGSCTGLYLFLKSLNHKVNIIIPNNIPDFLKWLPGTDHITIFHSNRIQSKKILENTDLVFYLDFNSKSRIDEIPDGINLDNITGVMIDHHPSPDGFADIVFSDVSVSSTAEFVYKIIGHVNKESVISHEIATSLFVGIMTDTGCFSYNSSGPETFRIVAKLLETGINKDEIYSRVYDNFSFERMRLLGHCLKNKMEYFPEYRTAIISISAEELDQYKFRVGDSEGFVNYPLTIEGVVFSALFIEKKDLIKISFRSKGSFPVNNFSNKHFNGGGHLNAAGGESKESLASVLDKFKNLLPEYKNELLKS